MHRNIMIMDAVIVVVMVKMFCCQYLLCFFVFFYMIWCGLGEWCDCAGDGATVEVRH